LFGEDRNWSAEGQNDAIDPERTSALTEMFKVPKSQNRVDAKTPRGPCRDEFNRLSRLNENIGNSDQELWDMIA